MSQDHEHLIEENTTGQGPTAPGGDTPGQPAPDVDRPTGQDRSPAARAWSVTFTGPVNGRRPSLHVEPADGEDVREIDAMWLSNVMEAWYRDRHERTNPDPQFTPLVARRLPAGVLDCAARGANQLDSWAQTRSGRNLLAHALLELRREGWLATRPASERDPGRDVVERVIAEATAQQLPAGTVWLEITAEDARHLGAFLAKCDQANVQLRGQVALRVLAERERDNAQKARRQAEAALEEYRHLFSVQERRMADAIQRWRAVDPEQRANVTPDPGDLLAWLMEQIDDLRGDVASQTANVRAVQDQSQRRLAELQRVTTELNKLRWDHARCASTSNEERQQGGSPLDEWCIVEMLGRRQVAGRVREVEIAGTGMLRVDIPAGDGNPAQTQYISPASIYALSPTTEAIATAAAARFRPEPVNRFQLPAARPPGYQDEPQDEPQDDGWQEQPL